jgi:hypothetical protein
MQYPNLVGWVQALRNPTFIMLNYQKYLNVGLRRKTDYFVKLRYIQPTLNSYSEMITSLARCSVLVVLRCPWQSLCAIAYPKLRLGFKTVATEYLL